MEKIMVPVKQESKRFSLIIKNDLGMACHTPPFKKTQKEG